MARSLKKSISKIIFKFTSQKGNLCFKLVTKTLDVPTGEILDGDSLITEEMAQVLNVNHGVEIKDLDAIKQKTFDEWEADQRDKEEKEEE